jgi:hypothetical protein
MEESTDDGSLESFNEFILAGAPEVSRESKSFDRKSEKIAMRSCFGYSWSFFDWKDSRELF